MYKHKYFIMFEHLLFYSDNYAKFAILLILSYLCASLLSILL
ncbi:hypothetical protein HMPREF9073_02073 [Capnocytophaga sp. oral taxon 326 str. F0382]|nr:hypothetical protein HMPREF9073_02073 [Capnocytophaga sp. oral taxon 326 str. F0382]